MEAKPIEVIMRIDFSASNGTEIVAHAEKVSELVRCKDCEFYDPFVHRLKGHGTCAFWDNMQTGENTFCSHGRKAKTV